MAEPIGLLAEFDKPEQLVAAVRVLRAHALADLDAFSPFPVDGLIEALGFSERRIPAIGVIGGAAGFCAAYAMQIAANLDYPITIGGRPLLALQSFALIAFELTVLFAVVAMIAGFFVLCRLPRYHHPLFFIERFEHATRDGFFVFTSAHGEVARALIIGLDPRSIVEVRP